MDSLLENPDLRFVFVGGKGGVGKTTSSSGIATALAQSGQRVLLVSTDPAHSLGDAWRTPLSNDPSLVRDNLWVMEVDPTESLKDELGTWTELAAQFENKDTSSSATTPQDGDEDDLGQKIRAFQEWLSGIPGIDEATALSSAISHIESGEYDIIVFDTAPTGHTIKLLQLPPILEAGIEKLQSWSTTIYSYWETFKGAFASTEEGTRLTAKTKQEITEKLQKYKAGIQRVGQMLTDSLRTRFVVVCIAEYLSVSETKRLLQDLVTCNVAASHVIVNQLVTADAHLTDKEMAKIEKWANTPGMSESMKVVATKARNACRLTSSRRAIQTKYLTELQTAPQVQEANLTIVQVPLLPEEVTGPTAIGNFSKLLTSPDFNQTKANEATAPPAAKMPRVLYDKASTTTSGADASSAPAEPAAANPLASKVEALLEDPEIQALIEQGGPKAQNAIEDLKANPMNVMTYMADPELQPLVQAAMKKLF
mmetsp:Transcript_29663/g.81538  ORF Transcript_29663/g.81538 Transcript_29663/m.81538 type:complete len:481 (+) Transcript_29663:54-1496(+)|eukprot:CAMPEP_0168748036 /NCGR_PEP_ID=MMETSP0724-20121128/15967_1 /TAXON_ID=265536 /ORGANISM="Amphiprora sp., Strain CCMP467" /LENGTH=480 /DNA_ID=CAMNT_0008795849 /DNA_START=12 /DNA_END=1454 /DNA_ORIENTATION=-